jgi:hypothetical protein
MSQSPTFPVLARRSHLLDARMLHGPPPVVVRHPQRHNDPMVDDPSRRGG